MFVQLLFGLDGEAEIVGALDRDDIVDVGDLGDDGEVVFSLPRLYPLRKIC